MYQDVTLADKHCRLVLQEIDSAGDLTEVISAIFRAMVKYIRPRFPAFAALSVALHAFKKRDFGIFPDYGVVWLPTTVIGGDYVRYRTDVMHTVYRALLPVCMSEITLRGLKIALDIHGLHVLFLCDGSFLLGEPNKIRAFGGSLDHIRREMMRSVADTNRCPIHLVSSFNHMPGTTIDISPKGGERQLFRDIENLLCMA